MGKQIYISEDYDVSNGDRNVVDNTETWKTASIALVRQYIEAFDINYQKSEDMIAQAFDDDSDSEDVVEKRIHLLNVHYHTRVPVNSMRDVIIRLQKSEPFEKWIENGNVEAVKMIAICDGKNYFSFATKYCCFANPDMYPIFDSLSIKALRIFNESKSFYDEKIDFEKLRDGKLYEDYRKIVDGFIEKFGLEYEELSYKDLDKFLWLVGKNI